MESSSLKSTADATRALVEQLAAEKLDMRAPSPNRVQLVPRAADRW